jgi:hypothetical protein
MVAQPAEEIGRSATQLLLERIGRSASDPARRVLLAAELRVRESSGSVGPAEGELALPPGRRDPRRETLRRLP